MIPVKILVYGVLGKFDYWNIKYRIKEETVKTRLPSEALVKYYKSKGYEAVSEIHRCVGNPN